MQRMLKKIKIVGRFQSPEKARREKNNWCCWAFNSSRKLSSANTISPKVWHCWMRGTSLSLVEKWSAGSSPGYSGTWGLTSQIQCHVLSSVCFQSPSIGIYTSSCLFSSRSKQTEKQTNENLPSWLSLFLLWPNSRKILYILCCIHYLPRLAL